MDVQDVAAAIGVEVVGRLAHGENSGAYEVRLDGRPAVLKFGTGWGRDLDFATEVVRTLRTRGYPAPATLAAGTIDATHYEVSELAPGTPIESVRPGLVPPIVDLVDLQRDVGLRGRRPWIEDVVTSITEGRVGYCELDAMRRAEPELLARVQRIAGAITDLDAPVSDVVHYDFSPYNVLADGDRITGVVDWQGATMGDSSFDLVTMAYYSAEVVTRDQVLDAARGRTDPRALELYAAHMVLRQVDWCLRNHDATAVWWFRDLGTSLLDALRTV